MESSAIFPIFYIPPTSYFSGLKQCNYNFKLEIQEHFPKQTYRNRASIYSPNGTLDLMVPVIKGSKVHTKVRDVKISDEFKWQRLHWKSFESCYRNSAYFEYYEPEFYKFYTTKYNFLFDINIELFQWVLKQLKLNLDLQFTDEYFKSYDDGLDFRSKFVVKDMQLTSTKTPYFQVFDDREGFKPNLSIVDLLFNQGPQAKTFF
ncbi:WbqC family protein [Pedobacter sp. JCM 36344]|uniref:WbqC family protein n=1 Tax=Pedobacter sp. JCM 36344 TaxID=3374280 RepID=UPI00397885DA